VLYASLFHPSMILSNMTKSRRCDITNLNDSWAGKDIVVSHSAIALRQDNVHLAVDTLYIISY